MRLWDYRLVPYLPNSQLKSQWRELNAIFKGGKENINHLLINYIKDYDDIHLYIYTVLVEREFIERDIPFRRNESYNEYFKNVENKGMWRSLAGDIFNPFPKHHTDRYLLQCFYNLQEKYDRRQKDFDKDTYDALEEFVRKEVNYEIH